eukprot:IDg16146t1
MQILRTLVIRISTSDAFSIVYKNSLRTYNIEDMQSIRAFAVETVTQVRYIAFTCRDFRKRSRTFAKISPPVPSPQYALYLTGLPTIAETSTTINESASMISALQLKSMSV